MTESADSDSMLSDNNKKQLLFAGQIKRAPKPTKKSQIFHLHAMYFILKQERKVQYFLTWWYLVMIFLKICISTVVVFHSWFQFDLDSLAFVACLKMTEGQNPWSFRTYNCKKRNDGIVILFLLNFSGQNSADEIKIIQEFCSEFSPISILQSQNKHPILMLLRLILFKKMSLLTLKKI